MHEISLTGSLLDIIFEYARNNHFSKVNAVKVSFLETERYGINGAGGYILGALQTLSRVRNFQYDIAPIIITCLDCDTDSEVEEFPSLCRFCKSPDVVLKAGTQELSIVVLDVD